MKKVKKNLWKGLGNFTDFKEKRKKKAWSLEKKFKKKRTIGKKKWGFCKKIKLLKNFLQFEKWSVIIPSLTA
ncbi:MAG TPA: hypothetical protein IAB48_00690 [Candidatus Fimimorpha excrementavium]|nr:hypothetical protein [Candidatus Fimimorpha excrementavium]